MEEKGITKSVIKISFKLVFSYKICLISFNQLFQLSSTVQMWVSPSGLDMLDFQT